LNINKIALAPWQSNKAQPDSTATQSMSTSLGPASIASGRLEDAAVNQDRLEQNIVDQISGDFDPHQQYIGQGLEGDWWVPEGWLYNRQGWENWAQEWQIDEEFVFARPGTGFSDS